MINNEKLLHDKEFIKEELFEIKEQITSTYTTLKINLLFDMIYNQAIGDLVFNNKQDLNIPIVTQITIEEVKKRILVNFYEEKLEFYFIPYSAMVESMLNTEDKIQVLSKLKELFPNFMRRLDEIVDRKAMDMLVRTITETLRECHYQL